MTRSCCFRSSRDAANSACVDLDAALACEVHEMAAAAEGGAEDDGSMHKPKKTQPHGQSRRGEGGVARSFMACSAPEVVKKGPDLLRRFCNLST